MTEAAAVTVALSYHRAWSEGEFSAAMEFIADDIGCSAPSGPITGAADFRQFMGPFASMAISTEILGVYGDERNALIMYDATTPVVEHAPGAELVTVVDGRITTMKIIFDQLPFARAAGDREG